MKKILIAIPCMDKVDTGFCSSLVTMAYRHAVDGCGFAFYTSSLIYDSRNCLALEALQNNTDFVVWFDSDMTFGQDILERLFIAMEDTGADMVSGLYFRRVPPHSPVVFPHFKVDEGRGLASWDGYEGELTGRKEVDAVGFGCVLMKTEVLKGVHAKYNDFFSPIGKVGEDLSFCWRAKQAGYKLVCDFDIQLGHMGNKLFTIEDFKKEGISNDGQTNSSRSDEKEEAENG